MTASPPGTMRLDTLVCRLAGGIALVAAAIFLTALFAVTRLPLIAAGADAPDYAIPGTGHAIDAAIVPVLAWCGGVAAVLGCAALAIGASPSRKERPAVAAAEPRHRSSRRPLVLLVGGALALTAVILMKR